MATLQSSIGTLATDVAETSLTLPDVATVIDSGLHRSRRLVVAGEGRCLQRFTETPIPLTSSLQRRGRAGRTGPGRFISLYRVAELEKQPASSLLEHPTPVGVMRAKEAGIWDKVEAMLCPAHIAHLRATLRKHQCLSAADLVLPKGLDVLGIPLETLEDRCFLHASLGSALHEVAEGAHK